MGDDRTWELSRAEERERWWVREGLHSPQPRTPLAATVCNETWDEVALCMAEQMSIPDTRGLAIRTVNGYTYMTPMSVTDPAEIGARAQEFQQRLGAAIAEADERLEALRQEQREEMDWWRGQELSDASLMDLLPLWRRVKETYRRFLHIHFMIVVPRHIVTRMLTEAARELTGRGTAAEIGLLTRAMGVTTQLELDIELWRLAGAAVDQGLAARFEELPAGELLAALADDPRAATWLEDLRAFLDVHGARAAYQLEIGDPSWQEDPEPVLGTLRSYVAQGGRYDFDALMDSSAQARDELLGEFEAAISDPDARRRFRDTAEKARILQAAMEDDNVYLSWSGVQLRYVALEIGRRLATHGVLESADDVFYLEREEVESVAKQAQAGIYDLAGVAGRVAERRALRERQMAILPPAYIGDLPAELDDFLLNEFWGIFGRDGLDGAGGSEGFVEGVPASAGAATGTARLVRGPGDFGRVERGDILVCPSTNPVWSPLFSQIAGIVTDQGGTLCHAAIVAREYGIPAVLATHHGTVRIPDGATVRVDGDTGRVEVVG